MFENRRWLVIPVGIIENINFDEVHETKSSNLRKSIDETLTFVKYDVKVLAEELVETTINIESNEDITTTTAAGTYGRPSIYSSDYTEYNHAEILTLLDTDAWTNNSL